jgi:hypothetical protein
MIGTQLMDLISTHQQPRLGRFRVLHQFHLSNSLLFPPLTITIEPVQLAPLFKDNLFLFLTCAGLDAL